MVDAAATVRALAAPLAAREDVDLVDVTVRGSGPRTLVRVTVDRKGGVDLGRCQRLSKALSTALDSVDPLARRYALEVTSPGTDAPLRTRAAFDRVSGRAVLLHRRAGDGTVAQLRGTIVTAEEQEVVLDVEGQAVRVPYAQVIKATQVLPW